MNWPSLFLSSIPEHRHVSSRAEGNSVDISSLTLTVQELQRELEGTRVVQQALFELLTERLGISDEEIEERVRGVVAQRAQVRTCVDCGRPLSKSTRRCMYCPTPT